MPLGFICEGNEKAEGSCAVSCRKLVSPPPHWDLGYREDRKVVICMDPTSGRRRCRVSMMVGDSKYRSRPFYFRRCKKERPTSIDSLPDELLFSILVGFPGDYLYDRARLVCRRWYHIIHSRSFIDAHHQHSKYCLLYSYDHRRWSMHSTWMTATATQGGLIQRKAFSYVHRPGPGVRLLCNCNGLMLEELENNSSTKILQIINPATKQALLLPPFSVPHTTIGMAYAAASMEYKVAISYYYTSPSGSPQPDVAILSVGVDNSWRQVGVDHLSTHARTVLGCREPLLTEGFMHWVDQRFGNLIVTLDVETEILTVSELSSPTIYKCKFYLSTGRSLSLLAGNVKWRNHVYFWALWEMNSETKEWTLLRRNIKLGSGYFCRPRGWIKYPEVLAFSDHRPTLIFFNLDTHETYSTELPHPCAHYNVGLYKTSLKWLT